MTTAMNEAEKLADRLQDIATKYRFAPHEHGVIDGAASILRRQAEQIKVLREALYDVPPLAELREKLGGWDVPEVSGKQAEQGGTK